MIWTTNMPWIVEILEDNPIADEREWAGPIPEPEEPHEKT